MHADEGSPSAQVGSGRPSVPFEIVPGLACVAVFVAWAVAGGGFAMTSLGPGALFLVALLGVTALTARPRFADIPPATRFALGLFAAFVVWNFLSITWADVQGIAWDGANRALLYFTVFAIFTSLAWRQSSIAVVMGVYAAALGAVALIEVLQAAGSSDPQIWFIGGRFAEPTNYANAVAALFIGGFWSALFLGGRRETPWVLRGPLLAVAALLLEVALMTQSRGFVIVFPIAVIAYLGVVTQRLRALIFLALVGIAVAATAPTVLDVFTVAEGGGDLAGALGSARDAMVISIFAMVLIGTAVAFIDRRVEIPAGVAATAGRVTAFLAAGAAIVGVVAAFAAIGNPGDWINDRWVDFKGGYTPNGFQESRFTGDLGSNRYDFWRVAIDDQVSDAPLIGEGSDNFAATYLVDRHSEEEPLYPHSLPIQILGGTGIIGLLVFGAFVVAVLLASIRARVSAASDLRRGLVGVSLAAATYFALHSSGDWLWSFPAIAAPVFAWLGMASRPTGELAATAGTPDRGKPVPASARAALIGTGLVLALFAAVSIILPWLAARDVQIATDGWGSDPPAAFERLDRAAGLNFLSAEPEITAGAIASAMNDREQVTQSFSAALEREPDNWYALMEIGVVDGLEGRRSTALAGLDRALADNPREPLIREVKKRIQDGDPMTLREVDQALLDRVCAVVGLTDETRFCG